MAKKLRIGTRESPLAVWQATEVKELLLKHGYEAELIYIKSDGDIDLKTPLYAMGVQGVFTRSLDVALLREKIDVAVHSMKDVPVQLAEGIIQSAVLKRASYKDLLVFKNNSSFMSDINSAAIIATSSIRRKAQWLNRYPQHNMENLRGNVNTRLSKLAESNWNGAIFAAAGLERINLRPENSIELDWMLPAPAQGAIMVVSRKGDDYTQEACGNFNDADTSLCTRIERDFLKALMGGCSTPISALAAIVNGEVNFQGNMVSPDGNLKAEVEMSRPISDADSIGSLAAKKILQSGGQAIADTIHFVKN